MKQLEPLCIKAQPDYTSKPTPKYFHKVNMITLVKLKKQKPCFLNTVTNREMEQELTSILDIPSPKKAQASLTWAM